MRNLVPATHEDAVQALPFHLRVSKTSKQNKKKMCFSITVSSPKSLKLGKHFLPAHHAKLWINFAQYPIGNK